MASFEELQRQVQQAQQGPANSFEGTANQAGVPVPQAEDEDLSILDRVGLSLSNRQENMTDIMAGATGLERQEAMLMNGGNPLSAQEEMGLTPTAEGVATQVMGNALGLVWDVGADAIIEIGQEGFGLLPDSTQEATKEQVKALAATDVGQMGLSAWQAGADAWTAFENKYPQQARTLAQGFNLLPGAKMFKKLSTSLELTPLKLNKVGYRKVLSPPKGRDKDVYNMITPEQTKATQLAQVNEGRVTDPQGWNRRQAVVPTQREWDVVDEVSKLGVNPGKSMQTNFNIVHNTLEDLSQQTIKVARRATGGADKGLLFQQIRQQLDEVAVSMPGIFGTNGSKGKKTIDDILAQLDESLVNNGTSWEGVLVSRQQLDNFLLEQIRLGTFGTGKKATALGEAHKVIRNVLNSQVKMNVPGTEDLLRRQSLLFDGIHGMAPKAADEASTSLGRLLQAINMHNPTTPMAQVSTFLNPLVWAGAAVVTPFALGAKAAHRVMGMPSVASSVGATRYAVRDVIREAQKALKMVKDPEIAKQLRMDLKVAASILHTLPPAPKEEQGSE